MAAHLFSWLGVWWMFYSIFNYGLVERGVSFKKRRLWAIGYILTYSLIALWIFEPNLRISGQQIILVVGVISTMELTFLRVHKKILKNNQRKVSPIGTRAFEVAFQQIMVNVLAGWMSVMATGIVFMIGHLPLLMVKRVPRKWQILVIAFSLISGLIFGWIIKNLPDGWMLAYLLHISFYYIFGAFTGENDQVIP